MKFDYENIYSPRRVHQVPDALSLLTKPKMDEDDEMDEEIPTFEHKLLKIDSCLAEDAVMMTT